MKVLFCERNGYSVNVVLQNVSIEQVPGSQVLRRQVFGSLEIRDNYRAFPAYSQTTAPDITGIIRVFQ